MAAIALMEKNSNTSLKAQLEAYDKAHPKPPPVEVPIENRFPENFGEVATGIYRSSFPQPENFIALKRLGLKTIITLVEEPYSVAHKKFLCEGNIKHVRILIKANKDHAVRTSDEVVVRVLEVLLNPANHPVLIHCNKGKHRTGCIVGCYRKVLGWKPDDVTDEYLDYSFPKDRALDRIFIEMFDPAQVPVPLPLPVPQSPSHYVENHHNFGTNPT